MRNTHLSKRSTTQRLSWLSVRVFVRKWVLAFGICALAIPVASCARMQARTAPDGPPLDMPAPPARVIAPVDEPISSSPAEPAEPTAVPPSTNRRQPPRRTTTEPPPKPETTTPAAEPPMPAATTPEATRPAETVPTLRAPGSAEKPIRDRLIFAQRDLGRVDYAKLSPEGRLQYEQSKRFVQQAEQALKDQNFVFAQTLADKAATLAEQLLGR